MEITIGFWWVVIALVFGPMAYAAVRPSQGEWDMGLDVSLVLIACWTAAFVATAMRLFGGD